MPNCTQKAGFQYWLLHYAALCVGPLQSSARKQEIGISSAPSVGKGEAAIVANIWELGHRKHNGLPKLGAAVIEGCGKALTAGSAVVRLCRIA